MYRYTVKCTFTGNDSKLIDCWLEWLKDPHIGDVMACGASGAEIVRLSGDQPAFEIRYHFPSRDKFVDYQSNHAPRLRQEGLEKFPLELGLQYERSDGHVVYSTL